MTYREAIEILKAEIKILEENPNADTENHISVYPKAELHHIMDMLKRTPELIDKEYQILFTNGPIPEEWYEE